MSTTFKSQMAEVMNLAWQMAKRNGYSMSEALKTAWANIKLKAKMKACIVRFYFRKVDGSTREAFGTLSEKLMPETKGTGRKANETLFTYFDTEKGEYRSFKKANLLSIAYLQDIILYLLCRIHFRDDFFFLI